MARLALLLAVISLASGCGEGQNRKFEEIRGAITNMKLSCPQEAWYSYEILNCTYVVMLKNVSPSGQEIEPRVSFTSYDCNGNTLDSGTLFFDRISSEKYQVKRVSSRHARDGTRIRFSATTNVFDSSSGKNLGQTTLQGVDGDEAVFGECS